MTTMTAAFEPPFHPPSLDPRRNRVAKWINETNAHSPPPSDSLPCFQQPPHRQRRLAMTSAAPPTRLPSSSRLPSNQEGLPKRRCSRRTDTSDSTGSSLHPTSLYTTTASDETGPATFSSTAFPALVLLVSTFACAVLLPSLLILFMFAVFLTIAPMYDSIQRPQFLPLYREASIISLDTDEDITEQESQISASPPRVRRPSRRRGV